MDDLVKSSLVQWLACAAFLLVFVKNGLEVWGRMSGKAQGPTAITPQPLEVKAVKSLVTEEQCDARHKVMAEAISNLQRQRDEDNKMAGDSRRGIYTKIDAVKDQVSGMERRLAEAAEDRTSKLYLRIERVEEEIRVMPQTIVRLMKDMKDLNQ